MVDYRYNEPYYKLTFSELAEDALRVLSFEGEEAISQLFQYRFELVSGDAEIEAADVLNKKATFIMTRGQEEPLKIHGIISFFEQRGRTPDYVFYHAVLVPQLWRTTLNFGSRVFQDLNVQDLVSTVLEEAGFGSDDFEFSLNESYPELEYCVQYRETDFNFINRRLEHYGIYYYFDHSGDKDKVVFTDAMANLKGIEQENDIPYNPNRDPLSEIETVTELTCQEKVVTGLFKLKDYNYRQPNKNLTVDNQIDRNSPGVYYDYGDHFKDENEGKLLVRVRNEEVYSTSKIFRGKSDCRLFRAGYKFTQGGHYRDAWNDEYLLTRLRCRGSQQELFALLPMATRNAPVYENVFEAIPTDREYRSPRRTPIPRIPGIMTARMESGNNDEYAFLDDQGRYKVKQHFDLSDRTNGGASRAIRMAQPYSGPGYGIHFPNHADTEMVWSCIDGNVDRPLGLSTVPNPANSSPSTSSNKAQSIIRTAAQNELTFDDTTGKENIYLHGTKDWTIDIVNDKTQSVGHDESTTIGNDRSREVGNDETISIGNNQTITVGSNREKSVGSNQSESIGANKTITVGGNHTEQVSGNMSQTVGMNKTENVAIAKATSIGAAYQISVGAAMNETVGALKAEEIGASKIVAVGVDSSERIGSNKSVSAGKNISESAGQDFNIQSGKKMSLSAGDDFAISGGKKGIISIKDELVISCGSASITLKKNGDITIQGKKINIKASGNIVMKGKKILEN